MTAALGAYAVLALSFVLGVTWVLNAVLDWGTALRDEHLRRRSIRRLVRNITR